MPNFTTEDNSDILDLIQEHEPTDMQLLIGYERLYKTVGSDQPSIPRIIWNEDNLYKSLLIDGKEVSIDMISRFYHVLLAKAETLLKEHVLLGAEFPAIFNSTNINETDYKEMPSSTASGYSFLNDPANRVLNDRSTATYLVGHIFSTHSLALKFFGVTKKIPDLSTYSNWLRDVARFVELIAILIHISSGQPTRGTEITATTLYNNNKGGIRNLYWTHKTLMITQSYNKSSYKIGDKYIARFLPKNLSYLVVVYLAVVRPFERIVSRALYHTGREQLKQVVLNYDTYLFVVEGKLMQSKTLSNALGRQDIPLLYLNPIFNNLFPFHMYRESLEILQVPIKVSVWRHIAIAFMYSWLEHFSRDVAMNSNSHDQGDNSDDEFTEQDTDTIFQQSGARRSGLLYNEQSGHSAVVGFRSYAQSSSDFSFLSRNNLANFHLCSIEWHFLLSINISNVQREALLATRPTRINLDGISTAHYLPPNRASTSQSVQSFGHPLSQATSQISAAPITIIMNNQHGSTLHEQSASQETSYQTIHYLRTFFKNESADFTSSEQASAISHVLDSKDDLLFVSGTGSGKSMLFFLPAFVENVINSSRKMTVVVVPLVSLTTDMVRRGREHGLRCITWSVAHNVGFDFHLLFVAAEHCMTVEFRGFLNMCASINKLARIVVDEAHLTITQSSFRSCMRSVHSIRVTAVPLILLSATVPIDLEYTLKATYAVPFMPTIRSSSTVRANLKYTVLHVDLPISATKDEIYDSTVCMIKTRIGEKGLTSSAGIIYVPYTFLADQLVQSLQDFFRIPCLPYYANCREKHENQKKFMSEDSCVIIATNAFGCGIDKPNVHFVYHWDISGSILDYAQESGRAARDSSIIGDCCMFTFDKRRSNFVSFRSRSAKPQDKSLTESQLQEMCDYVKAQKCLRYTIHKVLDPSPVSCFSSNKLTKCDICERSETRHILQSSNSSSQLPSRSSYDFIVSSPPVIDTSTFTSSPPATSHTIQYSIIQSAHNNRFVFKTQDQIMLQIEAYVILLDQKSACALCYFEGLLNDHHIVYIQHKQLYQCPLRSGFSCFFCLGEHRANACPQKLLLPEKAICFACQMYDNDKPCIVSLHEGSLGQFCTSKAKDKIICVCYWLLSYLQEGENRDGLDLYLKQRFSLDRELSTMSIDDFTSDFLFANSDKVDLFNYFELISVLLDFGKDLST